MNYSEVLENQKKWLIAVLVWLVITIIVPNIITGILLIISIAGWIRMSLLRSQYEERE